MSFSPPPVISFELGVGDFRIVTPDAVYQIKVCGDLVAAAKAGAGAEPDGAVFFKEISEELFGKLGRLARRLSVSVEELPADMPPAALDDTEQRLENAKGQLEEIMDITEKASMGIMDSADEIQANMDQLKNQLDILRGLDLMAGGAPPDEPAAGSGGRTLADALAELRALAGRLLAGGAAEPAPLPGPEPEAAPGTGAPGPISIVHFDVDVVFQTLYELCTNESVKDHIKSMRDARETAFNGQEIAGQLTDLAATVTEEDGFYNFPIATVLKTLYAATTTEDYRATLKKMNQTAASIFLDSVLPVEGEAMEIEAPAAPEAPPAPEAGPEPAAPGDARAADLAALRELADELEGLARAGGGDSPQAEGGAYTAILTRDRDTIVDTVTLANDLISRTGRNLTSILENLSFQDLSGQRIKRVVSLIGDIQTQLLSILVSVDTKLKVHEEHQDLTADAEKTEKMAQAEVDKALERLAAGPPSELMGPGAENRLNQGAVNDLLSQLGF